MARDEIGTLVDRIQTQVQNGKMKQADLIGYAKHAEARVRVEALKSMWDFPSPDAAGLLRKAAFDDPAPSARAAACMALGRYVWTGLQLDEKLSPSTGLSDGISLAEVKATKAFLLEIWRNNSIPEEVRGSALGALAHDPTAEIHEGIQQLWDGEALSSKMMALDCMGRTAHRRWRDAIISSLEHEDRDMVMAAMRAAAEGCVEKSEARLLEIAQGDDRQLAMEAIWSLRNVLHTAPGRKIVEKMARGKDVELKAKARLTLSELDAIDLVESPEVDDD